MSELDGRLQLVRLVDFFDGSMEVLPRKVRRILLIALLLLPGGAFVNWYVEEKTAGYEELLNQLLNDVVEQLLPPGQVTSIPEGPEAV